ncbi:MAG: cytochrome c [Myxococcota bacterium]
MIWFFLSVAVARDIPSKALPPRRRGRATYLEHCAACHGERALGDGPLAEVIDSPALAGRLPREGYPDLIASVLHGQGQMPAYSEVLRDHDLERVFNWLNTLDPDTGIDPKADDEDEDEDEEKEENASRGDEVGENAAEVPAEGAGAGDAVTGPRPNVEDSPEPEKEQ